MKQLMMVAMAVAFAAACEAGALAAGERPLDVEVVRTFENLRWPDWITGADRDLVLDPRPVVVTGAGDGSNRLLFATQYGVIFAARNDAQTRELKPFLDIRERVMPFKRNENEEGFLGLAFHPRFKENGEFFVYYTAKPTAEHPHRSIVSRFRVLADDPNRADPASEEVLMRIEEPYWNHNGGTVVFGPDGYLYIGLGDGGLAADPHGNGQNLRTLLGSILRIDVDHRDPPLAYAIPRDNPFVGRPGRAGRSGPTAFATCGGRRSIGRRGPVGRPTSAKILGRRSTSSSAAATTAGTSARDGTRFHRVQRATRPG